MDLTALLEDRPRCRRRVVSAYSNRRSPGGAALEQRARSLSIHRRREVEPLRRGAAQLPQEAELLRRLHPLGAEGAARPLREGTEGGARLRGLAAGGAAGNRRGAVRR